MAVARPQALANASNSALSVWQREIVRSEVNGDVAGEGDDRVPDTWQPAGRHQGSQEDASSCPSSTLARGGTRPVAPQGGTASNHAGLLDLLAQRKRKKPPEGSR